jgi:hypothetical protein
MGSRAAYRQPVACVALPSLPIVSIAVLRAANCHRRTPSVWPQENIHHDDADPMPPLWHVVFSRSPDPSSWTLATLPAVPRSIASPRMPRCQIPPERRSSDCFNGCRQMSRSLWRCRNPSCLIPGGEVLGRVTRDGGLVLTLRVNAFRVYLDTRRAAIYCPACGESREFRGVLVRSDS